MPSGAVPTALDAAVGEVLAGKRWWTLVQGDCVEAMRAMPEASVDAVVCDPPYGLEFMGSHWDKLGAVVIDDPASVGGFQQPGGGNAYSRARVRPVSDASSRKKKSGVAGAGISSTDGATDSFAVQRKGSLPFGGANQRDRIRRAGSRMQEWHYAWAIEALRVLKPGGYLLAFGGSRTYHRLACAIEDAGFDVRDSLVWVQAQGFPKNLDASKAIDKRKGASRPADDRARGAANGSVVGMGTEDAMGTEYDVTEAGSDEAAQWEGFGTALRPSHEPVVLARKPLIGTLAENILAHGTGALNIDGARLQSADSDTTARKPALVSEIAPAGMGKGALMGGRGSDLGRWPPNVLFSHLPECEQVGTRKIKGDARTSEQTNGTRPGGFAGVGVDNGDGKPNAAVYGDQTVPVYRCAAGCPVAALDAQSGTLKSGATPKGGFKRHAPPISPGARVYGGGKGLWKHEQAAGDLYGDEGGASRFFPVLSWDPQYDVPIELCALCEMPSARYGDMISACLPRESITTVPAQNAVRSSVLAKRPLRTAPTDARDTRKLATGDRSAESGVRAPAVEWSSPPSLAVTASTVPVSVPTPLGEQCAQAARSAGSLCDSCAIAIAQSVVAMERGRDPASPLGQASTTGSRNSILNLVHALCAASQEKSDTIPTTESLTRLFQCVVAATRAITTQASRYAVNESAPTSLSTLAFPAIYCPKAQRSERELGCHKLPPMKRSDITGRDENAAGQNNPRASVTRRGEIRNSHPTCKPVAVMRWLAKLSAPPGSVILDPFLGSGTTGVAALHEGFRFIGIEREAEYAAIAEARVERAERDVLSSGPWSRPKGAFK